jgi:hypothetical protein
LVVLFACFVGFWFFACNKMPKLAIVKVAEAAECILTQGMFASMNKFN